jgi:hypothetical protein
MILRQAHIVLKIIFCCLLLFPGLITPSIAQLVTPKYSNEFMNLGVGGRALGMANAQVAISNDVSAGYWNPAGLTRIRDKYQASFMHASYFGGMANYDYAGFSLPTDSLGRFAVTAIRFAVDDIPDTRFLYDADGRLNYDNVRFFSAADYGFLLSYARIIPKMDGLRVGANAKIIHRTVGEFAKAWGFGLDAGLQYEKNDWQFGLMLRDITGTFNAWVHEQSLIEDIYQQTGNAIPQNGIELTVPRAILGAAKSNRLGEKLSLLASADLVFTFDGQRNVLIGSNFTSIDPALGLEFGYDQLVFIRMGTGNFQKVKGLSDSASLSMGTNFGIGLALNKVYIDYALTDIGDVAETPYSHVFSIKIGF